MATDLFVEGKGCAGQAERRKKCSEIRKQFDSTREARNGKFKLNSQKKCEAANQKAKARYSDNSSKFRKFRQDNKGKSWKFCTVYAKSKKTRKVTQEKYDLSAFKAAKVNAKKNSFQQVERCWRKVDSQGSGKINSKQLDNLCNKFGLLDKVPADKNGECTFESFATWWFSDKTTKKHEANADKKDKVAKAKSSRPTRKKESYQSKKEDQEKRSAKQAQTQKWRDAFKAFKGEQQKIKATPVGRKQFITVHTPSRKKLDIIHFDITKYQPAHAPWRSLRQVEKLWTKFDKAGTGSLDAKTFDTLVKELGLEDSCDQLAKQDTVRLADFTSWWFGPEKATYKPIDKFSKEYQQKRNSARKTRAARPRHNTANVPSNANQARPDQERKWVQQRNQFKKHLREARKQRGSDHRGHNEITIYAATPGFKYSNTYSYNKYRPLLCDFGQQDFTYLSSTWNKVDKLGSGRIHSSKVNEVLDKLGVKDRPEGITRRNGTIHYEDFVRWFHNSPEQTEEKTDVDEKKRAKHDSIQKQCKTTAEKRKAKYAPKSPRKARRQQREEANKKYKARTDELKKHIQSNSPTKAKTLDAPLEIQWAHRVEGKKKKDLFKYDQSTYKPLYLDLGLQRQKGQVERCFDKYDSAKTGRIKESDIKKLVEDLGLSKATDLNALYAKCKDGEIIVEDFLRWWFSEARDTSKKVPSAPPSPPRARTKKKGGASPRSPARRGKDPVKLLSKNQRDVARYQARLKAAQKSKQLKKFVKESPKKLNRDFNIEIFAKDPRVVG